MGKFINSVDQAEMLHKFKISSGTAPFIIIKAIFGDRNFMWFHYLPMAHKNRMNHPNLLASYYMEDSMYQERGKCLFDWTSVSILYKRMR